MRADSAPPTQLPAFELERRQAALNSAPAAVDVVAWRNARTSALPSLAEHDAVPTLPPPLVFTERRNCINNDQPVIVAADADHAAQCEIDALAAQWWVAATKGDRDALRALLAADPFQLAVDAAKRAYEDARQAAAKEASDAVHAHAAARA